MKPLISICMPVYNSAEYLDKCLDCLTNQTHENIEIIMVVDGEMKDDSLEICESWANKDKRIKVVVQEHAGLSTARNTGLNHASGEYIGIVDPDDYIEYDMYEKLLCGIQDEECELCIEGFVEQEDGKLDGIKKECFEGVFSSDDVVEMIIKNEISDFPWNKLYKRELFENLRYPDGNNYYDVGTTYKLIEKAQKIRFIPYAGYHYIKRSGSITGGRRIEDYLDSMEMHIKRFDDLLGRRKELRQILCKDFYGSCVSLAAAGFVSGRKSRIVNATRRKKYNAEIQRIRKENSDCFASVEKMVLAFCVSNSSLGLMYCLGLEQCRRWIKGK